ncbi:hypothetical protein HPP92_006966 [Vanilla planifolia]|uniref:Glucan endo-1,3-beta-D-glucosidase n=1 Tax=Vanilla planifolia TaxID=51239 RepID=A0A835V8Y8_VANPL|nr:hypothetical protein HPP92_006966 [Vanilla planifolia]
MKRIQRSLESFSISGIKVSTPHAMSILQSSFPPSSGRFRSDIAGPIIRPMLDFLRRTSSIYFVDVYPYFGWSQNPSSISLDYALFQANSTLYYQDPGSGFTYTNLLDQMIDAVAFAMEAEGFANVKIGVAETGWPNAGDLDEIGANLHNAAVYNRNLAQRVADQRGLRTPARPDTVIPVFIFALFNENLKPGPGTERHWGLLYPNGTAVYEIDLRPAFAGQLSAASAGDERQAVQGEAVVRPGAGSGERDGGRSRAELRVRARKRHVRRYTTRG